MYKNNRKWKKIYGKKCIQTIDKSKKYGKKFIKTIENRKNMQKIYKSKKMYKRKEKVSNNNNTKKIDRNIKNIL